MRYKRMASIRYRPRYFQRNGVFVRRWYFQPVRPYDEIRPVFGFSFDIRDIRKKRVESTHDTEHGQATQFTVVRDPVTDPAAGHEESAAIEEEHVTEEANSRS
jgi:hypothetical protein